MIKCYFLYRERADVAFVRLLGVGEIINDTQCIRAQSCRLFYMYLRTYVRVSVRVCECVCTLLLLLSLLGETRW